MKLYKIATDVYRGDTAQYDINDYNPAHGTKSLGKDLASSMAYGPGIYFVSHKDIAEMYGPHITKKSLQSPNLISPSSKPFNKKQIQNILKSAPKETLIIASSNWDENYQKGLNLLIDSITNSGNPINQILSIWADVFSHQNPNAFIQLMVDNKIDGITIDKTDSSNQIATYYVIYNKQILS